MEELRGRPRLGQPARLLLCSLYLLATLHLTQSRSRLNPGYVPLDGEDDDGDTSVPPIDDVAGGHGDTPGPLTDYFFKEPRFGHRPGSGRKGAANETVCDLVATDPNIYSKITSLVEGGAKLLEYNVNFPEYDVNPLMVNMSRNFMAYRWARAFTKHGKTLLALSFNYDVLSLSMLTFGVEKVSIDVVDSPKGCFGRYMAQEKLRRTMAVVMSDFRTELDERQWVGEFDYACYQVIENDEDNVASFEYRCCERSKQGHRIGCTRDISVKWIRLMSVLVVVLKVSTFLAGPLFLQHWVYSESLEQSDYVVKLKDPMQKSVLVKKVKRPGDNSAGASDGEMKFSKFREIIKNMAPERIHFVSFRKLQVQVDHRRLITEKTVPIGLFLFIYESVIRCGVRRWEPFLSCCKQSVFGSWSPRFLWFKLRKRSECNNSCKKYCSWEAIFNLLGGALLMLAIPIPYYIRVAIYYAYEEEEVSARKDAIQILDLKYPWEHTLIHYANPRHPFMVVLYATYGLSFMLLAAFRSGNAAKFDPIAVGAVQDMRNVNRVECFRLIMAHFLLPFEKFGICGALVGILYWPLALPVCLLVTICYCTPTLYLLVRFLIHSRPAFLRTTPRPTSPTHYSRHSATRNTLSEGTSSFETCLLLENISPERRHGVGPEASVGEESGGGTGGEGAGGQDAAGCCDNCDSCEVGLQRIYTAFLSVLVGLLCSVFMLSVMILFADVLGFLVEVFVFTLMGAIVNASSAAKYLMLAFWILMYSSSCFNNVYSKYLDLNEHIFKFIKNKLKDDIKDVTMLREDMQKNTAFKYFDQKDLGELRDMEIEEELDSDFEAEGDRDKLVGTYHGYGSTIDNIEYIDDRLHWRVNSLVLFVDSGDEPRIPKELFHEICAIEAPGCPGPVHLSLIEAFKQLSYMIVFIVFVLITVMAFGDAYKLSSTNQLLVTLAGGFLPFVVRFVMVPKKGTIDLNSYSYEGKIHQIIYKFNQVWPVYDLSFKVESTGEERTPAPGADDNGEGGGPDRPPSPPPGGFRGHQPYIQAPPRNGGVDQGTSTNPSHVDLLITIRDDVDDDNLHPEPGSFGSRGSLPPDNSATRLSPDDQGYPANNPSNAMLSNPERGRDRWQSTETQTGGHDGWGMGGGGRGGWGAGYTSTSTQVDTPPGGRPVDLMVDMVRGGGIRVHNQTNMELQQVPPPAAGPHPENGLTMWPSRGSPYRRVPGGPQAKDESSV